MLFCFVFFLLILSFVSRQSRTSLHTTGSATSVNEFLEIRFMGQADDEHWEGSQMKAISAALEAGLQTSSGRTDRGPLSKMCLASRWRSRSQGPDHLKGRDFSKEIRIASQGLH